MTSINPQNRPERERIWTAMLNGSLSFEAGRELLFRLDGSREQADAAVASAMEQRKAGLAAGASWTQIPETVSQPLTQSTQTAQFGPVTKAQGGYLAENPQLAWNRAFNIPSVGANPFQKWQGEQASPAYSAYAGKNLLDIMSGQPGTSFGSFLGQGDLAATPMRALETLRNVRAGGGEQQTQWMQDLQSEDVGGNLKDMFMGALQGRGYASPFARAAARNVPGYQQQWNANTLGGSQPGDNGTLLAYLMKKLGL